MDLAMRSAWLEIDLKNLAYNYKSIKKKVGSTHIIPIVKADAYGHGAISIANKLLEEGAKSFGVATLAEAVELRDSGIECEILILGLPPRDSLDIVVEKKLTTILSSLTDAKLLSEIAQRQKKSTESYIAVETGMGRLGFTYTEDQIRDIISIKNLKNIKIKGLFSHLASADSSNPSYTQVQIKNYKTFLNALEEKGLECEYNSLSNSAGIINFEESYFQAVRPGIVLYGCYPSKEVDKSKLNIKPLMNVKSKIVLLKKLPKNSSISYGQSFVTARDSLIATLPLGYADGLPRLLSNKGRVIVRGQYAPIVGRICMDQCMIDVSDIAGVKEYDEVTILGKNGNIVISPEEIGEKSGTINYEVLCRFGQRLPKIYK